MRTACVSECVFGVCNKWPEEQESVYQLQTVCGVCIGVCY